MAIISEKIVKLMNYRIQQEEASSRIYKAMSSWLGFNGYTGAEKLWQKYSDEERIHLEWAYAYLLDLNIKPDTPSLPEPQNEFKGLAQIIALSYSHEVDITNQVKVLAKAAQDEGDYLLLPLALKYCSEQVEELSKTQLLLDQLESFGSDKIALRLLDNYISENLL